MVAFTKSPFPLLPCAPFVTKSGGDYRLVLISNATGYKHAYFNCHSLRCSTDFKMDIITVMSQIV